MTLESEGWKILEAILSETIDNECNLRLIPYQDISVKNGLALKKASGIVERWINEAKGLVIEIKPKVEKYD